MNPLLLLSLVCAWPSQPAPVADTWALIAVRDVDESLLPVVVSRGFVIRADPRIGHITGKEWTEIKGRCRQRDWKTFEFSLPIEKRSKFRFRLNTSASK